MKRLMLILMAMTLCSALQASGLFLPTAQKMVLKNGLTVYHLQRSDVPLVTFQLLIPGAGVISESPDQEGLADLTAELLLKGTRARSAEQLAEAIDFLGASLNVSAADEFTVIDGGCLKENFAKLLDLAGESLLQPAFTQEEFAKERDRRIDQIKSLKDNPARAIRFYFRKAYFGSHPLGHLTASNERLLPAFDRETVVDFYQRHYLPGSAVMAVVGDLSAKETMALVEKAFTGWTNRGIKMPRASMPLVPTRSQSLFLLIDKPDATQAYFALGAPGIAMGDNRQAALDVMNTLFGGRFTSWLNEELRVKRGLTYGARSGMQSWNELGLYTISSYTRNEKIGEMLEITFDLLNKARTQGFSEEEITSARNYILGQFPPTLESNSDKASAYTNIHFYHLGMDYYTRYLQSVQNVKPETAKQIAQDLLPQQPYVLVVVGKADDIRGQLSQFGKFVERKISDPGF